jgi:uncharacterized protein YoxC
MISSWYQQGEDVHGDLELHIPHRSSSTQTPIARISAQNGVEPIANPSPKMEISPPASKLTGISLQISSPNIMTQATDADIREIKTALEANTRAISTLSERVDTIAKATEANTLAINTLSTRVDAIAKATEANAKAIADLTTVVTGIREEMRVGFSDIRGQINTSEAKLEGKINQLDERTKLGFWGFIFRGTALAALATLTAIFIKYLFPILPELPH